MEQPLTPQQVREAIARVMSDGRERTSEDVAHATHISAAQIRGGLHWMQRRGLLVAELSKAAGPRVMIYCKAEVMADA